MEKYHSDTSLTHNLLYVKKTNLLLARRIFFSIVLLTGISEVEVILNVTSDVVILFMLYPMCVWLLIIPDENSKQHNHSNLPDKADSRQTDPNIGVLSAAEQIAHAVATVPHGADSLLMLRWSLLALLWCPAVSQEIYRLCGSFKGCALNLHWQTGDGHISSVGR